MTIFDMIYAYLRRQFDGRAEEWLHYLMTVVGGFLGGYAICSHGQAFGSAQTGNLLSIMVDLAYQSTSETIWKLGAFLLFSLSMSLAYLIARCTSWNMRVPCLWLDGGALVLTMLLPDTVPSTAWLYPIFIASSFQWGTYSGARGYSSPSLFLTGNLKQCVLSWTEYAVSREKKEKDKAWFYTVVILAFLAGAYFAGCSVRHLGRTAALVGLIPLAAARGIIALMDHE